MNILHLTLKKEWFDKIAVGEKVEEYREVKPYWSKRFLNADGTYKLFDEIHFKNGYSRNAPFMRVGLLRIFRALRVFEGEEQEVFVLELKKVLELKR